MKKPAFTQIRKSFLTVFLLSMSLLTVSVCAETMINVKMGPAWPKEMRINNPEDGITAWEPSVEIGMLFNKIVGIGFDAEFQWKRRMDDSTYIDTADVPITVEGKSERFFLFPPSVFISIDPVPDLIIHPVIRGQIGLTLLYYGNKWYDDDDLDGKKDDEHKSDDTGLYYGVFGKAGLDALYDLGENVSVFGGFEFQFGKARNRKEHTTNEYYYKSFYGPGIRLGFRFLI
jgi:hypothetical protein